MSGKKIYNDKYCSACYFRTVAEYPNKKCLLQLTEKCNLHCAHCFVSADAVGQEMDFEKIRNNIIPQLVENNVTKVTLTGGEPFVYSKLQEVIELLSENNIEVSICTNATLITEEFLNKFSEYDNIHFNVSLDGFSPLSHGKFRGNQSEKLYNTIISNITLLGKRGLLNGILVTPNMYSKLEEYVEICKFAKQCHAKYVLMNPLSQFGRGEENVSLAFDVQQMEELRRVTQKYNDNDMEIVYIRFPNSEKKPLSKCVAGEVMYIFTNGDIAFCPYMVFAARDSVSQYKDKEFILGNVFDSVFNWKQSLENYTFPVKYDDVCRGCNYEECQKGCYATRISQGDSLLSKEKELCPFKEKWNEKEN